MYALDFNIISDYPDLLIKGLQITMFISIISSFFAFLIGIIISFLRNIDNKIIKFLVASWVELTRNTPLLVQLYILFKGLPRLHVTFSPIACGIIALSLYTGAYISEVLRSGINAVAKEQYQAARSLGLTRLQTFKLVIFPQAIKIVIPPLGSQFINLVKNSSLVSFIAVTDVFYVCYKGAVDDFRIFEFFVVGAAIYMGISGIIALITNIIEKNSRFVGKEAAA